MKNGCGGKTPVDICKIFGIMYIIKIRRRMPDRGITGESMRLNGAAEIRMRRSDREIKDFGDIVGVMERCDVCRLALNDGGYPYILPLNFGMQVTGGRITLYFHGASEGKKYELMKRDNRAGFEMDCAHRLVLDEDNCSCTMEYESVMGRGVLEMVPEEEKYEALRILMKHYRHEDFPFNKAVVPRTNVFKLTVEEVTGKARKKK